MPIQQEVQMVIVDKDLRPAFTGVVQIAYAIVGVIDGLFTEFYLFTTQDGYANAYYIAAVIYVIASVLLLVSLPRSIIEFWTQLMHKMIIKIKII